MFSTNRRRFCAEIFMVCVSFVLVLISGIRLAWLKREAAQIQNQAQTFAFSELPAPETRVSKPSVETEPEAAARDVAAPLYVIRLVGSELRMISYGQEEAYTVLPSADPRTFREADRLRLTEGVEIYTYEELAALLEDFSS